MPELERRTHVYVLRPKDYEMSGCSCGNSDPDWSEYKGRLWCPSCKVDFVPTSGGIFGGPVPVQVCGLMGIDLRELNLTTGEIEDRVGQCSAMQAGEKV